jgi:hypothetical protein
MASAFPNFSNAAKKRANSHHFSPFPKIKKAPGFSSRGVWVIQ